MSVAMPVGHTEPARAPGPAGFAAGRLREEGLAQSDRQYAMWIHLVPALAFLVVGPLAVFAALILWLSRRDRSPYVDDHGQEVLNMAITGAMVSFLWLIPFLGWIAAATWYVVALIGVIRGAVAASGGEYFRYPMIFRFLS